GRGNAFRRLASRRASGRGWRCRDRRASAPERDRSRIAFPLLAKSPRLQWAHDRIHQCRKRECCVRHTPAAWRNAREFALSDLQTSFQAKGPNVQDRVRASFARQRVMQTLGISITRLEPGVIELTMPYDAAYTQQHGFIHAGIISAALDSACGYAAFSLMPT